MNDRERAGVNVLQDWRTMFGPDDGAVLVLARRAPTETDELAVRDATHDLVGPGATRVFMVAPPSHESFASPQRSWPLARPHHMIEDPANNPNAELYVDVHTEEAIRAVGAWRWPLIYKHRSAILPLLRGRTIDFGGLAGSIGYGSIVVDHGAAEYRALYDVPGRVDTIFSSHTLEHVQDLNMVLQCMVSKATGHLILQVPSWRCEMLRTENWAHHYHNFCLAAEIGWQNEIPLDAAISQCADVVLADTDGHSILVIASLQ